MRKTVGFALFFISLGMLLAMLLSNTFVNSVIIVGCVTVSYHFTYRIR